MNDRFSADVLLTGHARRPPPSPWPIDLAHIPPFALGGVKVCPASRELVRADRRENVEPLVMQVLVALAAARGQTLSRDDLIAACWGGRAVTDDALNRVISRLRALSRALGGFRIETITKVGYRLTTDETTETALPFFQRMSGSLATRRSAILGGVALAGAAGVAWLGGGSEPEAGTSPEVARLIADAKSAAREGMPDDIARAAALYQQGTEREPDNAEAWGGLASTLRFQWEFGPPEDALAMAARVRSAAARALELDPDNGDAQAATAGLIPMFGNWREAEAAMRPVLARHPDKIQLRYARLLADTGRLEDALAMARDFVTSDPNVPRARNLLGRLLQDTGRTDAAETVLVDALRQWPRHLLLWFSRFYFLVYTGRPAMALAFAADRGSRPPGATDKALSLAFDAARAMDERDRATIESAVGAHLAAAKSGTGYAENAVTFLAAAGRLDEAFAVIDAYFFGRGARVADGRFGDETATYTPRYNRQCAFLFYRPNSRLRGDPRFAGLVRELGLEDYWRQSGTIPDYRRRGRHA